MINYRDFFPERPDGEDWIFRYRRGHRGSDVDVVTLRYLTRHLGDRLDITLEQKDGPVLVGMFDRLIIDHQTLGLCRIQVPEENRFHDIDPPFSLSPDPGIKEQVEHMLPDVFLAAFCEPPHTGHIQSKRIRERNSKNDGERYKSLDIRFYTVAENGGARGVAGLSRYREGIGLVLYGIRYVGHVHVYVRLDGDKEMEAMASANV